MQLTVVICTFNRASMLKCTLESFLKIELPKENSVELIIVDNNSSDDTALIAKQFSDSNSQLVRAVHEPTAGLCHARNTGIAAARGNIIAFADDDVYFDNKWVIEILFAFSRDPAAYCVGGRSIPLFEGGEPDWIVPAVLSYYGSTNSGTEIKVMRYPEHPFGLNMAFRREVFNIVGTFNTNLGRIGSTLLSNDETDLFYRISHAGLKTVYTPYAIIHHRIPKARTEKAYILRRCYWQGISDVVFRQSHSPTDRRQLAYKVVCGIRETFGLLKRRLRHFILSRDDESTPAFLERVHIAYSLGVARQSLREIFSPTPRDNGRIIVKAD